MLRSLLGEIRNDYIYKYRHETKKVPRKQKKYLKLKKVILWLFPLSGSHKEQLMLKVSPNARMLMDREMKDIENTIDNIMIVLEAKIH